MGQHVVVDDRLPDNLGLFRDQKQPAYHKHGEVNFRVCHVVQSCFLCNRLNDTSVVELYVSFDVVIEDEVS
jgi:hypothetical protein